MTPPPQAPILHQRRLEELNTDCYEKIFTFLLPLEIMRFAILNGTFIEAAKYVYFKAGPQEVNFLKDIGNVDEKTRNRTLETFGKNWKSLCFKNQTENVQEKKRTIAKLAATLKREKLRILQLISFPKIYLVLELMYPLFHNLQELILKNVTLPNKISIFLDHVANIKRLTIKNCEYPQWDPYTVYVVPILPNLTYLSLMDNSNLHTQEICDHLIRFPKVNTFIFMNNEESYVPRDIIIDTMPYLTCLTIDIFTKDADTLLSVLKLYRRKLVMLALCRAQMTVQACKRLEYQDELLALYLKDTRLTAPPSVIKRMFNRMIWLRRLVLDNTYLTDEVPYDQECPGMTFEHVVDFISESIMLHELYIQELPSFRVSTFACLLVKEIVKKRGFDSPIELFLMMGTNYELKYDVPKYNTNFLIVRRQPNKRIKYEFTYN